MKIEEKDYVTYRGLLRSDLRLLRKQLGWLLSMLGELLLSLFTGAGHLFLSYGSQPCTDSRNWVIYIVAEGIRRAGGPRKPCGRRQRSWPHPRDWLDVVHLDLKHTRHQARPEDLSGF